MKKAAIMFLILCGVISAAATGCTPEGRPSYESVVMEHARVFLPMDGDGKLYEDALSAAGEYLAGEMEHKEALKKARQARRELQEAENTVKTYQVSEEMSELLEKYGIIPEEFEAFGNFRAGELQGYMEDVNTLCEYMEDAESSDSAYQQLEFWHDQYRTIQENNHGYYYYMFINYWFAGWKEKQVDYVKAQILDRLECYLPEDYDWETDKDTIEDKGSRYLDAMDECRADAAVHMREKQEQLQEMEK
ncbi:MAG: hypothetical protein HFH59_02875 [Lachnospiraceae bacterium]|nr:hypothetical protein [Lachnospiraceae bacterium]